MSKKIASHTLSDEIIEKMKNKITESIKADKELGFILCRDIKTNIIKVREECEGEKCNIWVITPETKCKKGEELAGIFHSHGINSLIHQWQI